MQRERWLLTGSAAIRMSWRWGPFSEKSAAVPWTKISFICLLRYLLDERQHPVLRGPTFWTALIQPQEIGPFTHALLDGSPAIDHGNNTVPYTVDQRGAPFARVSGAAADMGAYEVQQGDSLFSDGFDGPPTCPG